MLPVVLLVTCSALPDGDEEELGLLIDACTRAGLAARWVAWDDVEVDWAGAALSVVRSTWDYTLHRQEFLDWTRRVPRLVNPPAVIAWNSDKSYLRALAAAAVPVVPTDWAAPGEAVELTVPPGRDFVVKPSVGAGSRGAGRFAGADPGAPAAARAHIAHLHDAGRTAMIQPYLADVDERGETGLVFMAGQFSHAIGKAAMLPGPVAHRVDSGGVRELFEPETITPRDPAPDERAVALAALAAAGRAMDLGQDLLYARVDLLPGPTGPVVVELELTEPSLFLQHAPGAADRLAAAIAGRVSSQHENTPS